MEQNIESQKPKSKKRKIITAVVFIIIFLALVYFSWTQYNAWWQVRKEYVKMGFAEDKFPYRMYTERELVEKGLWSGESPALNAVPTRTTPEETYAVFRQAIIDDDLDKAIECFVENKRDTVHKGLGDVLKDQQLKTEMLNDLPEKLENLKLPNRSSVSYDYSIIREGKRWAQTMTFSKDWNGDWKIEDL